MSYSYYFTAFTCQVVDRHADEDVVLEPHQRVAAEVEEGEARQEAEGAVVDAREAVARQQDLGEMRRRVEEVRQYLLDLRGIWNKIRQSDSVIYCNRAICRSN